MRNWNSSRRELELSDLSLNKNNKSTERKALLGQNNLKNTKRTEEEIIIKNLSIMGGAGNVIALTGLPMTYLNLATYGFGAYLAFFLGVKDQKRNEIKNVIACSAMLILSMARLVFDLCTQAYNGYAGMTSILSAAVMIFAALRLHSDQVKFASRLSIMSLLVGIVSVFSSAYVYNTLRETPFLVDSGIKTGDFVITMAVTLMTVAIFGYMSSKAKIQNVTLVALLLLSSYASVSLYSRASQVGGSLSSLNRRESLYQMMQVTHQEQIEYICGQSKYSSSGNFNALVWEELPQTEAYLNQDCLQSFKSHVSTPLMMLFNSLLASLTFVMLALVSVFKKHSSAVSFSARGIKESILYSALLAVGIAFYLQRLKSTLVFEEGFKNFSANTVPSGPLVMPGLESTSIAVHTVIPANICRYHVTFDDSTAKTFSGCVLRETFKSKPVTIKYSYDIGSDIGTNEIDVSSRVVFNGKLSIEKSMPIAAPIDTTSFTVKVVNSVTGAEIKQGSYKVFQGWSQNAQLPLNKDTVTITGSPFISIVPSIRGFYNTPQRLFVNKDTNEVVAHVTPVFEGFSRTELTWEGDADVDLVFQAKNQKTGETCIVTPESPFCSIARFIRDRNPENPLGKEIIIFKASKDWTIGTLVRHNHDASRVLESRGVFSTNDMNINVMSFGPVSSTATIGSTEFVSMIPTDEVEYPEDNVEYGDVEFKPIPKLKAQKIKVQGDKMSPITWYIAEVDKERVLFIVNEASEEDVPLVAYAKGGQAYSEKDEGEGFVSALLGNGKKIQIPKGCYVKMKSLTPVIVKESDYESKMPKVTAFEGALVSKDIILTKDHLKLMLDIEEDSNLSTFLAQTLTDITIPEIKDQPKMCKQALYDVELPVSKFKKKIDMNLIAYDFIAKKAYTKDIVVDNESAAGSFKLKQKIDFHVDKEEKPLFVDMFKIAQQVEKVQIKGKTIPADGGISDELPAGALVIFEKPEKRSILVEVDGGAKLMEINEEAVMKLLEAAKKNPTDVPILKVVSLAEAKKEMKTHAFLFEGKCYLIDIEKVEAYVKEEKSTPVVMEILPLTLATPNVLGVKALDDDKVAEIWESREKLFAAKQLVPSWSKSIKPEWVRIIMMTLDNKHRNFYIDPNCDLLEKYELIEYHPVESIKAQKIQVKGADGLVWYITEVEDMKMMFLMNEAAPDDKPLTAYMMGGGQMYSKKDEAGEFYTAVSPNGEKVQITNACFEEMKKLTAIEIEEADYETKMPKLTGFSGVLMSEDIMVTKEYLKLMIDVEDDAVLKEFMAQPLVDIKIEDPKDQVKICKKAVFDIELPASGAKQKADLNLVIYDFLAKKPYAQEIVVTDKAAGEALEKGESVQLKVDGKLQVFFVDMLKIGQQAEKIIVDGKASPEEGGMKEQLPPGVVTIVEKPMKEDIIIMLEGGKKMVITQVQIAKLLAAAKENEADVPVLKSVTIEQALKLTEGNAFLFFGKCSVLDVEALKLYVKEGKSTDTVMGIIPLDKCVQDNKDAFIAPDKAKIDELWDNRKKLMADGKLLPSSDPRVKPDWPKVIKIGADGVPRAFFIDPSILEAESSLIEFKNIEEFKALKIQTQGAELSPIAWYILEAKEEKMLLVVNEQAEKDAPVVAYDLGKGQTYIKKDTLGGFVSIILHNGAKVEINEGCYAELKKLQAVIVKEEEYEAKIPKLKAFSGIVQSEDRIITADHMKMMIEIAEDDILTAFMAQGLAPVKIADAKAQLKMSEKSTFDIIFPKSKLQRKADLNLVAFDFIAKKPYALEIATVDEAAAAAYTVKEEIDVHIDGALKKVTIDTGKIAEQAEKILVDGKPVPADGGLTAEMPAGVVTILEKPDDRDVVIYLEEQSKKMVVTKEMIGKLLIAIKEKPEDVPILKETPMEEALKMKEGDAFFYFGKCYLVDVEAVKKYATDKTSTPKVMEIIPLESSVVAHATPFVMPDLNKKKEIWEDRAKYIAAGTLVTSVSKSIKPEWLTIVVEGADKVTRLFFFDPSNLDKPVDNADGKEGMLGFDDLKNQNLENLKIAKFAMESTPGIMYILGEASNAAGDIKKKFIIMVNKDKPDDKPSITYKIDGEEVITKSGENQGPLAILYADKSKVTVPQAALQQIIDSPDVTLFKTEEEYTAAMPDMIAFGGKVRSEDVVITAEHLRQTFLVLKEGAGLTALLGAETKAEIKIAEPKDQIQYAKVALYSVELPSTKKFEMADFNLLIYDFIAKAPYTAEIVTDDQAKGEAMEKKEIVQYIPEGKTEAEAQVLYFDTLKIGEEMEKTYIQESLVNGDGTPAANSPSAPAPSGRILAEAEAVATGTVKPMPKTTVIIPESPPNEPIAIPAADGMVKMKFEKDVLHKLLKAKADPALADKITILKVETFESASKVTDTEAFLYMDKYYSIDRSKLDLLINKDTRDSQPAELLSIYNPDLNKVVAETGFVKLSQETFDKRMWPVRDKLMEQNVIVKQGDPKITPEWPSFAKKGIDGVTRNYFVDPNYVKLARGAPLPAKFANDPAYKKLADDTLPGCLGSDDVIVDIHSDPNDLKKNPFVVNPLDTKAPVTPQEAAKINGYWQVVGPMRCAGDPADSPDKRRLDRDKLLDFYKGLSDEDKAKYFEDSSLDPAEKDKTRVVTPDGKVFAIKQGLLDQNLGGDNGDAEKTKFEALLEGEGKVFIVDPATKDNEYYIVDTNPVDEVQAAGEGDPAQAVLTATAPADADKKNFIPVKNSKGEELFLKKQDFEDCRTLFKGDKCQNIGKIMKVGLKPEADAAALKDRINKDLVIAALKDKESPLAKSDAVTCEKPFVFTSEYESQKTEYETNMKKIGEEPKTKEDYKEIIVDDKKCYVDAKKVGQLYKDGQLDPKFAQPAYEGFGGGQVTMDGIVNGKMPDGKFMPIDQGDLNTLRNKDPKAFTDTVVAASAFAALAPADQGKYKPIMVDGVKAYWPINLDEATTPKVLTAGRAGEPTDINGTSDADKGEAVDRPPAQEGAAPAPSPSPSSSASSSSSTEAPTSSSSSSTEAPTSSSSSPTSSSPTSSSTLPPGVVIPECEADTNVPFLLQAGTEKETKTKKAGGTQDITVYTTSKAKMCGEAATLERSIFHFMKITQLKLQKNGDSYKTEIEVDGLDIFDDRGQLNTFSTSAILYDIPIKDIFTDESEDVIKIKMPKFEIQKLPAQNLELKNAKPQSLTIDGVASDFNRIASYKISSATVKLEFKDVEILIGKPTINYQKIKESGGVGNFDYNTPELTDEEQDYSRYTFVTKSGSTSGTDEIYMKFDKLNFRKLHVEKIKIYGDLVVEDQNLELSTTRRVLTEKKETVNKVKRTYTASFCVDGEGRVKAVNKEVGTLGQFDQLC